MRRIKMHVYLQFALLTKYTHWCSEEYCFYNRSIYYDSSKYWQALETDAIGTFADCLRIGLPRSLLIELLALIRTLCCEARFSTSFHVKAINMQMNPLHAQLTRFRKHNTTRDHWGAVRKLRRQGLYFQTIGKELNISPRKLHYTCLSGNISEVRGSSRLTIYSESHVLEHYLSSLWNGQFMVYLELSTLLFSY